MKTNFLFLLFLFPSVFIGQVDWASKMQEEQLVLESFIADHKAQWPTPPQQRGQGFKQAERFISLYSTRLLPNGTLPSGSHILRTWEDLNAYQGNRSLSGNWHQLGPILDDVTTRDNIEGVGRTSCIAFHPTDPNFMIMGTPAGGIWRSFNGGQSWSSNTDQLPTLGCSSLLIDPSNPQIIYAGTGDRDANDSPGYGVLKSTDGGTTWQLSNEGIVNRTVGALKMHQPSGRLIAATSAGLFASEDAGATWAQTFNLTYNFKDLEQHPTQPDVFYTTGNGRFYRSQDGGLSWTQITDGISTATRMVIAVTPIEPDAVYVMRTTTYEFSSLHKSTDGGLTFAEMSDSPNIMGWSADGSSSGGQSWYNLCLEADHETPGTIYAGGIRMKKSVDNGVTWMDINPNFVHVDQHEAAINPHSLDLYVCNDGGIYHYLDNEEWLDISTGLANGQIYKLGQNSTQPNATLTGFQDNGTAEFNGAVWQRRGGGDGFECFYDFTDSAWRYGSIYYGDIYRTSSTFVNQKIGGLGELGINESGAWSSPFALYPTDEQTLFLGLKNIWRTRNVKTPVREEIVWEKISNNLMGSNTPDLIALEFSLANPAIMYASEGQRKLARTLNCLADTVVWVNLSTNLPSSLQPVAAIETHPTDTETIYIAFNQNVWKSTNGGLNWTSLTATFPDVAVNTIVMDTTGMPEALYIGTDLGIYYKDASMTEWVSFNQGFPQSARVTELEIFYGSSHSTSRLKAATYGRGLWESDLYGPEVNTFPAVAWLAPVEPGNEVVGQFEVNVTFLRNLAPVNVTNFLMENISVSNGSVTAIAGGPASYTVSILPTDLGPVSISVPAAAAIDANGVPTWQSDTLQLFQIATPEPLGPFGPGGVGDSNSMALWLRGDMDLFNFGATEAEEGDLVFQWQAQAGIGASAVAILENTRPTVVLDDLGNRMLQFDGVNDKLITNSIFTGRSSAAYTLVATDSIAFNEHGWFASARQPNGFLLHPWKDESQFHAEVLDANGNYSGSPVHYIGDATGSHLYGYIHGQEDTHQVWNTIVDDQVFPFVGINAGLREEGTPIQISFGHDFDDRYGKGRIGEHVLYKKRLFSIHNTIVSHYFAFKYGLNFGPDLMYNHPTKRHEVIGIGQVSNFENHTAAQGKGPMLFSEPSDLQDGEFLFVGTDNLPLTFTNQLYPILSERTERTWGISQTGNVGDVLVTFSGASWGPAIEEGMGLIVQEGTSFQYNGIYSFFPLTWTGFEWETTATFPAEAVMTLGYAPQVGVHENQLPTPSVFPNPAADKVSVVLNDERPGEKIVVLRNALGQTVHSFTTEATAFDIPLLHLPNGPYHLSIEQAERGTTHTTIIKH